MHSLKNRQSSTTFNNESPKRSTVFRVSQPNLLDLGGVTNAFSTGGRSTDKYNFQDLKIREPPNSTHSSLDKRIYYVVRTSGQNNSIRIQRKPQVSNPKPELSIGFGQRPQSSKQLINKTPLIEPSLKFRHTSTCLLDPRKPKVNIMNLELTAGDEESERRRQQQLEEIEMFKVMIERRKKERYEEREKERERFRQKCLELLNRNNRIKLEEDQPNYRLIREIISELKISRNIPNHQDHLRILALESSGKKPAPSPRKNELVSSQQLRISTKPLLRSRKKIQKMVFGLADLTSDKVYKKKIDSYLEFLFKLNFANCIYVDLRLSEQVAAQAVQKEKDKEKQKEKIQQTKYKVFVGKGNNSLLIKSLIKRRFWLELVDTKTEDVNFYWTQSKLKQVHVLQQEHQPKQLPESLTKKKMALKHKKLPQYPQQNLKIMSKADSIMVQNYLSTCSVRTSIYEKFKASIVTNHIPQNSLIGSKKALFHSLHYYYTYIVKTDPFQYIPQTFHIRGPTDERFKQFLQLNKNDRDKVWILKPGQNSNRGNGICLVHAKNIYSKIQKKQHTNGQPKTYIIQSYIYKPFLYHNRKFDIRHYMMITSVNGYLKAFWYHQGYIRTSSYQYDLDDLDNNLIHLTNDAIQKYGENYGKYQPGNKVSYTEFQRYLDMNFMGKKYNFQQDILPKMREMAIDCIKANFHKLDVKRKLANFEVFGLDFMIDNHFKPWLIEINFNPCLQASCPLLSRIIPGMIESSLRIGLDPLFPPPSHYPPMRRYQLSDNILSNLRFQVMFDQKAQGEQLRRLHQSVADKVPQQLQQISDHEQQYDDQGQEVLQIEQ